MTERAEHKGWAAHASQAHDYYMAHGGETMSATERKEYERLLVELNKAADRHDQARGKNEGGGISK